ncbi:AAA domain-containing protein, partial [Saccharomonospora halophila]|uniref:AAA domain-containing protein n=1 Tax=Saccharomonospora halophila TaxID=129922 RepID=UPI001E314ED0
WRERLGAFERAWAWAATATWLTAQESTDTNALQQRVVAIEDEIHAQVGTLAARRAWDYAASPERLDGTAKADLTQYAQLVKRGGKLSGKYAAERKADIRRAMERCRPAVPVWIMPLYRIAEQFRVQPDMFDVVIVDEASQAGLEATFLQYLAPKIVVIGDDKQVSPTAVGVDQQELRDLARQYLTHDRYRASWEDPKRSLFDEAKMRYGGLITLTEHRRCVPEIIGFSNRIAYEPDNIRLVPVRQYGNDRLDPIRAVHVEDGYQAGNKTNPAEAECLVAQVEECLNDPRYDGKTFGVISLLGQQQAKYIQNLLMERIPGPEWSARDLRCGDAADFQGSERDVMFLSMVSVAEEGRRLAALTADMYVQRYNVAVSRAKDQLWVFHSLGRDELHNPEDMRFQLLDYCYGVIDRGEVGAEGTPDGGVRPVPEDTPVAPFDSLFEQRVYNRIIDRGYTVLPQYEAAGYRIDLVVLGGQTRLAVECDGDEWHGPDRFEHDLARQRDLERCGWRFFRIPESLFYADPSAVLSGLWDLLRDMGIHPSGGEPAAASTSVVDGTGMATSDGVIDTGPVAGPASSSVPGTVLENAAPEVDAVPVPGPGDEPEPEPETGTGAPVGRAAAGVEGAVETGSAAGAVADADADTDAATDADTVEKPRAHGTGTEPHRADDPRTPEPYVEFRGTVASVQAVRGTILAGLREIVAVEGPITGDRLRQVYVRASGGQRLGKQIVSKLNSVISYAVRQGELVRDEPFGRAGVKPAAFRLPEQSPEPVREVGPRSVEEVPVRELAALMRRAADVDRDDDETVLRAALQEFGIGRLYQRTREQLLPALELARQRH